MTTIHQPRHSQSARRAARGSRTGAIVTTEMLFVLPVMVIVSLITIQFILIHTTYYRVQAAAIAGAELAIGLVAQGETDMDVIADTVHEQTGLMLGFMAGNQETKIQFTDADTDGTSDEADDDFVAVGVRIPMGLASTNYIGLLGANVDDLQINSIVCKRVEGTFTPAP